MFISYWGISLELLSVKFLYSCHFKVSLKLHYFLKSSSFQLNYIKSLNCERCNNTHEKRIASSILWDVNKLPEGMFVMKNSLKDLSNRAKLCHRMKKENRIKSWKNFLYKDDENFNIPFVVSVKGCELRSTKMLKHFLIVHCIWWMNEWRSKSVVKSRTTMWIHFS